ncbi:MAG TPA: sulfotransferase domain-containing protein [Candidatus Dormibacteraeota bacterium]|nr:sulfotransferase domain-containing protein [Verrucomicrobiae bacterium]HXJ76111.1 sulfotransferase domain-containing protein [Candidatus Dormibacteraeota bacterium]
MKKLFYRIRYGRPVVLVSGLPRSGTSMLMQMLEKGGVPVVTDKIRTPDPDNPKGYHEFERIKDLDKSKDKSWLGQYRGQVIKTISFLLQDLPLDLNYKVIFMRRNLEEVLQSQNKMLERNGAKNELVPDEKMRRNYEFHLKKVYYQLNSTPNFEVLYVEYSAVVEDPLPEATRINAFLGGGLNVTAMVSAVESSLYRNRQAAAPAQPSCS